MARFTNCLNTLLAESGELSRPYGLLGGKSFDYRALWQDVDSILTGLLEDRPHSTATVYVSGGSNPQWLDAFQRIEATTSPLETVPRLFAGEAFGIVVNRAERWHARLAEELFQWLEQYRQKSCPVEIELVLFIGNYGFTPFGIHSDNEAVMHLHLGPAEKTLYLAPPPVYKARFGEQEPCFQFDEFAGIANAYVLKPGDLLFCPPGWLHTGFAPSFSVDVVLAFSPLDEQYIRHSALSKYSSDLVSEQSRSLWPDLSARYRLASRSNGGFKGAPSPLTDDTVEQLQYRELNWIPGFVPQLMRPSGPNREEARSWRWFGRGHERRAILQGEIEDWWNRMSGQPAVTVGEWQSTSPLSRAEAVDLFRWMIQHRCLR